MSAGDFSKPNAIGYTIVANKAPLLCEKEETAD